MMDGREEADAIYAFIHGGMVDHVKREGARLAEMLPADDETRDAAKQLEDETIRREVERFIDEATKASD